MAELPIQEVSYWESSVVSPLYPRLSADLSVDVVIIGAGIAGLSAAYLLKRSGKTVAVVEKDTIGSGVSNNTTGKVTSQHNIIYNELYSRFGEESARNYADASQAALEEIEKIIKTENIACDWQRDDSYVYTTKSEEINKLKQESETAQLLGLPATYVQTTKLPFEIKGAVKFTDQARLHIKKYLTGLASAINRDGSYIFENTRANPAGVRDRNPCTVKTNGGTVSAKDVIVATNVPFTAGSRGSYCMMEYPQKSYIVAGKPNKPVKGMYISPDGNHYSIMPTIAEGGEQLLLIGGESHITGMRLSTIKHYQKLADYGVKHFGMKTIDYKWSARDYHSYDDIPLIGLLYPWSKHVYVTTAYRKWGLTNTMVSAMILRDHINSANNVWAKTFDSNRFKPIASIPRVFASYIGLR